MLQCAEGLTDGQAAAGAACVDWKFLLGLELEDQVRLLPPERFPCPADRARSVAFCVEGVQLSETCEPHAPHLITHVVTADVTVADTEVTEAVHWGMVARELLPDEHDVDAGYVTAAHIVTVRDGHGIELLGPVGLDTCHENHEGEHFAQSAFTIDWQAQTAACPQAKVSASWSDQRKSSETPVEARAPRRRTASGAQSDPASQDQQEALEDRRRE
ncbi:hypothetical protein E4K10_42875 [Streptomyces sp. T1317-0309]|nr:hypothetical protein E4K10_42875 [Streptomyces sp. T1317-0309]